MTKDRISDTVRAAITQTAAEISQYDLAPLELDRPQFTGKQFTGKQRRTRPLIAISAAAAVLVVVIGAVAAGSAVRHDRGPATQPAAPRYLVALEPPHNTPKFHPQHAVIVDSKTQKIIATIRPPNPYRNFTEVAAAADDRTFVLAAQTFSATPKPWVSKLFVLSFDPVKGSVSLRPLSFRFPTTWRGKTASWTQQGLALTPDGSKLAVAASPFAIRVATRVMVYSIATGKTLGAWQSNGEIGFDINNPLTLSWSGDDRSLEYMWTSPDAKSSFQLLDTAATSGSLTAHSRLIIRESESFAPQHSALLTADGTELVAAGCSTGDKYKIFTVSVRTGHILKSVSLPLPHETPYQVLWISANASIMIIEVQGPAPGYLKEVELRGHELHRLIPRLGDTTTSW